MSMKVQINESLWDVSQAVLRGKFIPLNDYIRKEARSQLNNLFFHLKN